MDNIITCDGLLFDLDTPYTKEYRVYFPLEGR